MSDEAEIEALRELVKKQEQEIKLLKEEIEKNKPAYAKTAASVLFRAPESYW